MRAHPLSRRGREAWRDICPCQAHARRERALWRRTIRAAGRAAGRLKARGIAFIIGVPLAFGALQMPTEAMDSSFIKTRQESIAQFMATTTIAPDTKFPIFTTDKIRENLLSPEVRTKDVTLDLAKEQFFRAHVPYGSIIYREALRNNLSPELVAAVVESESDFRVRLVSHKNAQGLMQVIPSTGRLMGAGDLFNPAENIAAGTKYLRYLFDRFGDDQKLALAAYNAGEGNVEKFGGVPPFPETINYLRRVNVTTTVYHQRVRGSYVASLRMRNSMLSR